MWKCGRPEKLALIIVFLKTDDDVFDFAMKMYSKFQNQFSASV